MKRAAPTMLEIRNRATTWTSIVHLGIALTYLVTPPAGGTGRALIVAYVEQLGPIWIGLFALSGGLLLLSRIMRRRLVGAHAFALGVSVFYAAALWASVIVRTPFALTVSSWAALALVSCHYALSRWYAAEGER